MNSLRCCRRLLRAVLLVSLSYCLLLVMCAPAGSAQRRERWQWPTLSPVPVASSFAPPVHDWLPGRRGVTLTYPGGSPVYACASGTVTFAGQVGGRGVVSIQHETRGHTIWSTYLPVTPSVSVGDTVTMGAQIGAVEDRIADPALGSKDRTENVRRSAPVDGRQAAAPALECELTRTRRVPCTRSSGDHHRDPATAQTRAGRRGAYRAWPSI